MLSGWWLPFYGLAGAVFTLPWTIKRTGPRPVAYLNLLMTVLAFGHCLFLLSESWGQPPVPFQWTWWDVLGLRFNLDLEFSALNFSAATVVTGLSLLAQVYALGYMEKDWALARFFALMGFFEGAICGLALSNSVLVSYGLLEMLTLSTYLLVGFWYAQPQVATAARDAFLTKRVGDLMLLGGLVALATFAPSLNFHDLAVWADHSTLPPYTIDLIGLALIAGPTGKCAQIPLHFWLDEAMEGPNPASILRNSVVVAAGAFFLIKMQPVIAHSTIALGALVVIGSVTAIGASLVSLAQIDIKRAISHSTSAYLGLVFVAVGFQQSEVAFLFLLTHALAKALIFMSVGSVILTTNTQNLNEMGGLGKRMPATYAAFLVGSASLIAALPLGSFWSMLFGAQRLWDLSPLATWLIILVNGLTALNLSRVFALIFAGAPQVKTHRAPEVGWQMAVPMISLIMLNLLLPFALWQDRILSLGKTPWFVLCALVASGVIGWAGGESILPLSKGVFSFTWPKSVLVLFDGVHDFLAYDLYIEKLYRWSIIRWISNTAQTVARLDRQWVDGLVNLVGASTLISGESLKRSGSGRAQFYLLTMLVGMLVVVVLVAR
jgi:NAD(P)H-quinone oxidoreductase subunit 5